MHVVADGLTQMFAFCALLAGVSIVGSFHTDLVDLFHTNNGYYFQKVLVMMKESVDSYVLDSCATTSVSFSVCIT